MAVVVEPADADALPDVRDGVAMAVVVEPADVLPDVDALLDLSLDRIPLYSSFANCGRKPRKRRGVT